MHPLRRGAARLWALLGASGCVVANPAYDGEGGATTVGSSVSGETSSVTTSETTSVTTTGASSTATTSGDGESEATSEAMTSTTTATDGTSTGDLTLTTDSGSDSDTTTTGGGEMMTLHNYGLASECKRGPGCINANTQQPIHALHKVTECFESPLPPPFAVSRVGVHPRFVRGTAGVTVKVFSYAGMDLQLIDERYLGTVAPGPDYKSWVLDPPVTVDVASFCVGYETSGSDVQLGPRVNDASPIDGASFLQLFDAPMCNLGPMPLTGLYMMPGAVPRYCIDVDIASG